MSKWKITGALLAAMMTLPAQAKELKSVGISLASLGNPFFVAVAKGATAEAQKINANVKVTTLGFDYDLNKQFNQIDNFIAAGVDLIILNPGDPHAVAPAIKRAQAAGIVVVAVDTAAEGADLTVMTDNVKAGEIACQYIVDKLGGKGDVVIENGPQVSSVIDRVAGCKKAFAAAPGIKIRSADQDAKGSRDGGLAVMQGYLTRYPKLDAVFTINDPQAIGSDLAAKQLGRGNIVIASVDGAPDIEKALASKTLIEASASQDPYSMAKLGVQLGNDLLNGKKPATQTTLIPPKLVTRDNVSGYQGWESHR
ncbi:ABC transporter substrate-binding protein [Rhodoblastus sp.]|uniref:ABC transporter substrate-binding protein n=1 Tax=Rhodoblastus sp. TaxID=1962975 RepID=UPI0035B03FB0